MKAYVVEGFQHLPTSLSQVLYVDVVDSQDQILTHQILYVFSGEAVGDVELPGDLNPAACEFGPIRIGCGILTNGFRNPFWFSIQKLL